MVLTATMVMSMLTAIPANATDIPAENANTDDIKQNQVLTVTDESNTQMLGATGDRTLELEELPEDIEVIESAKEYYRLTGKKYKVPSGGSGTALPSSVDNSQSKYFPAIGNQGGIGACVAWAQSYYQFTYAMNKARGIATTPENTFSPKFTYNIANGGKDTGSFTQDVYVLMKDIGNVPISILPYDKDCFSWSATKEIWREAIRYRIEDYQYFEEIGTKDTQITSADDDDLIAVKTALSNGEVLTYSTCIYDWKETEIKVNTATPENSKFKGQKAITHEAGSNGGHRMTLVGYNDNLWIDVNGNNKVDTGEMGAFKIANSWGTGYGNDGFIWVAYDALNQETAVYNGPATRVRIFTSIGRIDVKEYNKNSDLYLEYTFNTADRTNANALIIAEKDGSRYTDYIIPGVMAFGDTELSYDGTTKACDGTMLYPLDNLLPDLTMENFGDYTWKIKFLDEKKNDIPLTVKNAEIVDELTNKTYKPSNVYPITLENDSKEVAIVETTSNNVVVYYRGFYDPILYYNTGTSGWITVPMESNIERESYTHKYVIKLEKNTKVSLYFSDHNGNVDMNNSQYGYTALKGLNYFITENVADPLKVKIERREMPVDIKKLLDFVATSSGGYAPYKYEFVFTNLDTGEENKYGYITPQGSDDTSSYKYGYSFPKEGNYRIKVTVKDFAGNIASDSMTMELKDKPFEYTTFTATPNKQIMVGDMVELVAETNFENIIYVGRPKNQHTFTIKDENNNVLYSESLYAQVYSLNYKTSSPKFMWVPTATGKHTITVSTTDGNNQYAEASVTLDVSEYNGTIIGDVDNNKIINVSDAITLMKFSIDNADSSRVWTALSDCNKDDKVDIRDIIFILKYIINAENVAHTGEVNYREAPTYPVTEPPTQKPTEAPTNPVTKNIVTFTNSHKWGGTMYCYYWSDTNKTMTAWPGNKMTSAGVNELGEALYTYELPKEATYVIFTNGSKQTVDISYSGGLVRYYPTTTNSKGHYNVKTW